MVNYLMFLTVYEEYVNVLSLKKKQIAFLPAKGALAT